MIELTREQAIAVCFDDLLKDNPIQIIDSDGWSDGGKHSFKFVVFSTNGKHYRAEFTRDGNYYSDYYYDWDHDKSYTLECEEVKLVEVKTKVWRSVDD